MATLLKLTCFGCLTPIKEGRWCDACDALMDYGPPEKITTVYKSYFTF